MERQRQRMEFNYSATENLYCHVFEYCLNKEDMRCLELASTISHTRLKRALTSLWAFNRLSWEEITTLAHLTEDL